jgi:hypothetical protein
MTVNATAFAPRPLLASAGVRVTTSSAPPAVGYRVRLVLAEQPETVSPPSAASLEGLVAAAGRRPVRRARMPGESARRNPGCLGTIERATINRVEAG